jgi:hypothetical protein
MAKVTFDQIQAQADKMMRLAKTMHGETDGTKVMETAQVLQQMGVELEAMAKQFEKENPQKEPVKAFVEVQLTPGQQQRIRNETGIDMSTVLIEDPTGAYASTMKVHKPPQIEELAFQEARRRQASQGHEKRMKDAIAAAKAQVEGYPNLQAAMDQLIAETLQKKK